MIKVRALTDSLAAVGDSIQDQDVVNFVSEGLGPEFRPFISSLHSQPKIIFDDFIQLLIKEDAYLCRSASPPATENPPAFATNYENNQDNHDRDNRYHRNNRDRY